jgi:hypothetical protein
VSPVIHAPMSIGAVTFVSNWLSDVHVVATHAHNVLTHLLTTLESPHSMFRDPKKSEQALYL